MLNWTLVHLVRDQKQTHCTEKELLRNWCLLLLLKKLRSLRKCNKTNWQSSWTTELSFSVTEPTLVRSMLLQSSKIKSWINRQKLISHVQNSSRQASLDMDHLKKWWPHNQQTTTSTSKSTSAIHQLPWETNQKRKQKVEIAGRRELSTNFFRGMAISKQSWTTWRRERKWWVELLLIDALK